MTDRKGQNGLFFVQWSTGPDVVTGHGKTSNFPGRRFALLSLRMKTASHIGTHVNSLAVTVSRAAQNSPLLLKKLIPQG